MSQVSTLQERGRVEEWSFDEGVFWSVPVLDTLFVRGDRRVGLDGSKPTGKEGSRSRLACPHTYSDEWSLRNGASRRG